MKMSQISQNLQIVRKKIFKQAAKDTIKIVAVTKTRPATQVNKAISCGVTSIGENRVQEAEQKFQQIKSPVEKRFIGRLQSNKVKKATRLFDTIDSVDSLRLAKQLAKKLKHTKKSISVLLEINTSGDKTKFGFDPQNDQDLLESITLDEIIVGGLMTIGPASQEKDSTSKAFGLLRKIKENINRQVVREKKLTVLSMGMSNDFELGIHQGSTMVRLGTALFGPQKK